MEYKFKTNKVCLFHDENQGDEGITRMMCGYYAPLINAKYNGVIPDFTEDQIKEIANKEHHHGKFDYNAGSYSKDSVPAVIDYIRNEMGIECNYAICKNDEELKDWLDRGFAVMVGIKVNRRFYDDKLDGKLDMSDYKAYKGDIGHFTNIIRWNCRGGECSDMGKEYILDSYFTKNSLYECDIKEILEDIDFTTKYIIF